jgi:hypothetical protein
VSSQEKKIRDLKLLSIEGRVHEQKEEKRFFDTITSSEKTNSMKMRESEKKEKDKCKI